MPTQMRAGGQIGRSLPRLEGREKVTGRAEYTHFLRLPGMLYGKIFRSTVAHGRIKSVDASAAKKVPGVLHVVTIDDEGIRFANEVGTSLIPWAAVTTVTRNMRKVMPPMHQV